MPDAPPGPVRIGIFGQDAERQAALLAPAIELYGGRYALTPVSSDAPWGKASSALVKLIYEDHALALVAGDRNSSHLAEQIAVKAFLPAVALSADGTLTSVNIPWIFRLPADTQMADAVWLSAPRKLRVRTGNGCAMLWQPIP
ncbi:MAG: hypothetical protein LAQ69_35330 [Acidobacteriia bacterium]|nr:hypothetical protein [Terriglobia bacterium]